MISMILLINYWTETSSRIRDFELFFFLHPMFISLILFLLSVENERKKILRILFKSLFHKSCVKEFIVLLIQEKITSSSPHTRDIPVIASTRYGSTCSSRCKLVSLSFEDFAWLFWQFLSSILWIVDARWTQAKSRQNEKNHQKWWIYIKVE